MLFDDYTKIEKLRIQLIIELNDLDNTNKNIYFGLYFQLVFSQSLNSLKKDNKGIRLIKQYVFNIYKLMKGTSSEDEQKA